MTSAAIVSGLVFAKAPLFAKVKGERLYPQITTGFCILKGPPLPNCKFCNSVSLIVVKIHGRGLYFHAKNTLKSPYFCFDITVKTSNKRRIININKGFFEYV